MKIDELIQRAFDWYYEENIHNTNISNEEAVELFKDTETFKDYVQVDGVSVLEYLELTGQVKKKATKQELKTVIIDKITFDELIEYGKNNGANIVDGMPWSFNYKGCPIIHENDTCYLALTLAGVKEFTPNDVLITSEGGDLKVLSVDEWDRILRNEG